MQRHSGASLGGLPALQCGGVAAALLVLAVAARGAWTDGGPGRYWLFHPGPSLIAPVAIGDQGPPPPITPAILHTFQELLASYEAIGSNIPVSFGQWVVMNGITDLRTQWCLMWLWWNLQNQAHVD